jgi:hypothetical protein
MNLKRMRALGHAMTILHQARELIEEVRQYEQEAFNNLPLNLRESPQAGAMDVNVANLTTVLASIDEAEIELVHILSGNGE